MQNKMQHLICLANFVSVIVQVLFLMLPNKVQPLLSCQWVAANLSKVVCIDATWFSPNTPFSMEENGNVEAGQAFLDSRIPNSRIFDIDRWSADSPLPHMLPPVEVFAEAVKLLRLPQDPHLVFYDRLGIFSAPRAWWTFKCFGFDKVSVLDGGFPQWIREEHPVVTGPPSYEEEPVADDALVSPNDDWVWNLDKIRKNITTKHSMVIDARSEKRFYGDVPEARAGVSPGHIPNSVNVPFTALLSANRCMLPQNELEYVFREKGVKFDGTPLVASCGSGLTAAIIVLALEIVGHRAALYDGSWTEYGSQEGIEIATRDTMKREK